MSTGRTCTKCKTHKPWDEFTSHLGGVNNKSARCIPCDRARQAAIRSANPEKARAAAAKYREANREVLRERARKYTAANREDRRRACREYYQRNKETCHRSSRMYRIRKAEAEDPTACKLTMHKLYQLCAELNRRSTRRGGWAVDHTIPLTKGGLHTPDNLQVVPGLWNLKKNARHSDRWGGAYPRWVAKYCIDIGLSFP